MNRIWHDGAMRALPLWLIVTMLNTSVLLGYVFFRLASRRLTPEPSLVQLMVVFWLAIALYLLLGKARTRCQRIELTLPIPARALWRRHFSAVLVAGILVLGASLGVLALHVNLLANVGRGQVLVVPILPLAGPLLAGLLLATSLIDSVEPGLWKLRGNRSYWMLTIAGLIGVLALLLLLHRWPWVLITLCVALSFLIIRRTVRSLPLAFRLVPQTAAPASRPERSTVLSGTTHEAALAATTSQPMSRWQVYRILFNVIHNAPPLRQFAPWMLYFFVALMGFVLAGGVNRWIEADDLRFLYLPFGSYMLLAGFGVFTYHLYRLDPLPVSRRTLFAILIVPSLIIYCAGYVAGLVALATTPNPTPLVNYRVDPPSIWVEVDQSFMGLTLDGRSPTLTSPWGESHEAWYQEVFRGSPALMYNPYNTSEETTADFEALMTSRAIETVYGDSIPPDEIRDRYFVIEDDRVVGLLQGGFPLLDDYAGLETPPGGPETPVFMILVLVPWLLLVAFIARFFRATHSNGFIRGMYWTALGLLMGAMLVQVALSLFGLFNPGAGRGFLEISIRQLGASHFVWLMTWVVSVGAIFVSYWFAFRQFKRAEIPASPINCSMVDWGKED